MRRLGFALALLASACKGKDAAPAQHLAEGAVAATPPDASRAEALAACTTALAAPRTGLDGGAGTLLAGCAPCGVSWTPLIMLSSFDPDGPAPESLPGAAAVLDVLDACQATCTGNARDALTSALRDAQAGKAPSKPWRKLAECKDALALDDRSERFARGTWYALAQIAKALWSADAPPALRAARDATPLEFPLPPLSESSTAIAVPHSDVLAAVPPRILVTIDQGAVRLGALPYVKLDAAGATLLTTAAPDYPGPLVPLETLDHQIAEIVEASRALDLTVSPALIAPRGMPARRLIEVLARMPGSRAYLAATPATPPHAPWPEPIGAIPIFISTAPPFTDLLVLDAADPGYSAAVDALPSAASAVRVTFAADATVEQVAAALSTLASHGLDRAALELKPSSP